MKIRTGIIFLIMATILIFSLAWSFPSLTGYSGAPDSKGNCASSCHGSSGGTITVSGFPSEYEPEQAYAITVAHDGGLPIANFNGSCRIGDGSANAGTITAGTNTATYNTSGETNGVHFTAENQASGTFNWTAPAAGTGSVTLYISGLQGDYGGANTEMVLTAAELGGYICGDVNNSGAVNILDVTYMIAHLYQQGPAPDPPESGDVNNSGGLNILDITYLIAYIYQSGPAPGCQ